MVAILISVAILLLASHPNGVLAASSEAPNSSTNDATNDDNEYESKIQQALSHHVTKSHQLLERALQEGGVAAAMEIGPDGNVASSTSGGQEELWQAEFALQAVERELKMLKDLKRGGKNKIDDDDDDDDSGDDDDDSGDGEEYDSGDDEEYFSGDDEEYFSGDDGDDYEYEDYSGDVHDELLKDKSLAALLDAIKDKNYRRDVYEEILDEAETKANLDPDLWHQYSYWNLHAYFSCHRVFAASRSVYDSEKWADLRQYYQVFRKQDEEDEPIPEGKPERTYQFSNDVFDPPLDPFQAGEKGRGLKAARDINKGELVFQATNNTVIFTNGHTWRNFLFAIYERNGDEETTEGDSETTCDVLVWSWVQALVDDGPLVIVADLDNGSLLNEGRFEPGWETPNVRCGKEGDTRCMMSYYATADIKMGDELLCDYREFALLDSWGDMGL
mmetsp:Transcript_14679/g.23914  ORF Transcript_14679/g.23914 Transcript_14679/m.23914 type:complete len:445 (-) Transcript_14679:283-1617(-)|eukprot:CAMPEP_0201871092 /NCGR_PEP_ID=MMETSP0902-20130614/4085_1 /ASSEMBLY_ACC=CAM_ASM_000551 /TAXON_ID=420261 /ORGANISM="Thalassiosira antarctica, Strain CCMP982" /LENGTH=444 /DNA_ID=CAMNT_0048396969 /DNA_START=52 /DNA_END=1386 /DNA_ORIENTATION=-